MTNIAVIGAGGRMGKALIETIAATDGVQLTGALENPQSSLIGVDAGELAGIGRNNISLVASLDEIADDFDVLIDFSIPAVTAANAAFCAAQGKKNSYWHHRSRRGPVAVSHQGQPKQCCMHGLQLRHRGKSVL